MAFYNSCNVLFLHLFRSLKMRYNDIWIKSWFFILLFCFVLFVLFLVIYSWVDKKTKELSEATLQGHEVIWQAGAGRLLMHTSSPMYYHHVLFIC